MYWVHVYAKYYSFLWLSLALFMYYFGWSVYKEVVTLERFYLAHLLFHIKLYMWWKFHIIIAFLSKFMTPWILCLVPCNMHKKYFKSCTQKSSRWRLHYKNNLSSTRENGALYPWKLCFSSSCKYTYGVVCRLAAWHTTVCLDNRA